MRRMILILAAVLFCVGVSGQGPAAGASAAGAEAGVLSGAEVLSRLKEANFPSSLEAEFTQRRHSPLLSEDLVSKGKLTLAAPDYLRWEIVSPKPRVSEFNASDAASARRFRLPSDKDFRVSTLEGEELSIILDPVRGDLKRLFSRIVVKVDPQTYHIHSVLLSGLDGDSTFIEFYSVKRK